jgi:hypothetical protein
MTGPEQPIKLPLYNNNNKKGAGPPEERKVLVHDPFHVFGRVMKEEFDQDFKETDAWKKINKGGLFTKSKKIIRGRAAAPNDSNPVMSMSTSTRTEKRDNGKLEVKTITKILRADRSVEKIVQASIVEKEEAKKFKTCDLTIAREASKNHKR